MPNKQLHYTAERVDELLGIVDGLGEATPTEAGLMSAEDKAKLDSVEGGAEENVIEEVQVGGSALTPANKVVNIPADSAPTSESTNLVRSGGVYTAIQQVANALLNYYTKAQVDALLAGVHQFTYQVVAELPDASADTMYILYFVPSSDPQTQNVKDEYITIRTGSEGAYAYSWEQVGSTEIAVITTAEIDALFS